MENHGPKTASLFTSTNELTTSREIVLVGIYHSPERGILFVQKYSDLLQLPGGLSKQNPDSRTCAHQIDEERARLQKFIFEKSGLLLDVQATIAIYHFPDKDKAFKAFLMTTEQLEREINWRRKKAFRAIFLQPDEIKDHASLKEQDRQIIIYYLLRQKEIIAKNRILPLTGVITIAD